MLNHAAIPDLTSVILQILINYDEEIKNNFRSILEMYLIDYTRHFIIVYLFRHNPQKF